jgi:hypothetical protein
VADDYEHGSWSCAYRVSPVEQPPSLNELLQIIDQVKGHETGWPVWLILHNRPEMRPKIVGDVIECWLNQTEDGDFWRADPGGRMFLMRKLQEDTREIGGLDPGTVFELTLPVWRTGECLLHAHRFARRLGANSVDLAMTWRGLEGRQLSTFASPMRMLPPGYVCSEKTVQTRISTDATAIPDTLPELVQELTRAERRVIRGRA